jgi:hypothetical protein
MLDRLYERALVRGLRKRDLLCGNEFESWVLMLGWQKVHLANGNQWEVKKVLCANLEVILSLHTLVIGTQEWIGIKQCLVIFIIIQAQILHLQFLKVDRLSRTPVLAIDTI